MNAIEFDQKLIQLQKPLQFFAYQFTYNTEDAADLVQETNLKAVKNRGNFKAQTNFKAWLYTIMRNTFINHYRKQQLNLTYRKKVVSQPKPSNDFQPEMALSIKDMDEKIHLLEEVFRVPFQYYQKGFKYKEIADKLNIPIGTVKSRIFLARKKLMDILVDYQ